MRLRPALLTGLALAIATTASPVSPAATAAVRYCNILSDVKGDGDGGFYFFIESPALDIISADIATGKNELVAVLRLASLTTESDNWQYTGGFGWNMGATLSGVDYTFGYTRPGFDGEPYHGVKVGNTSPNYTFAIEGTSLVWRIKRSELASLNKKPNQSFTEFRATTDAWGSTADTATAPGKKYPDKAPSCVKAR
jgi:hypothetical protein